MRVDSILLLAWCWSACSAPKGDLCADSFSPYQDLVSGRTRNAANAAYVDAMALYEQGDHEGAIAGLRSYLDTPGADKRAYLYLAVSQLAVGQPFEAELSIDQLENSTVPGYKDPCEWYTVLCWLCSNQLDRAAAGAKRIAQGPHTYRREAEVLLERLERTR
ncbi:MAG: hypothetical protein IPK70_10095 [Flavobacteriales bacterium]|jgi:hypothetical protein|nr:hypothetical protein [Flavobacteriales bacterium]